MVKASRLEANYRKARIRNPMAGSGNQLPNQQGTIETS